VEGIHTRQDREEGSQVKDFIDFIRKQGVVGLAIGFILGGAVGKVVTALVEDIVNPIVGLVLGGAASLATMALTVGPISIKIGHFISVLVDFAVVAGVVYFVFQKLGITNLDAK
jgi:large conductance mechanosensitive channel